MKIGLIIPGNIWFLPYTKIYTDILDRVKCDYDLISWNRDGQDKEFGIQYNASIATSYSKFTKLLPYFKYVEFINETISKNKYDKLIICGSQIAFILYPTLKKNYRNKYILDIRDLSIEQLPILKQMFKRITSNSFANIVSSPGFIKYLPIGCEYYISHNFRHDTLTNYIDNSNKTDFEIINNFKNSPIRILTIGGIRNFGSNSELIKALANNPFYKLSFVGKGIDSDKLEKFSHKLGADNVEFKGYYKKIDEETYVRNTTFINIYCDKKRSDASLISNRFYLALIHKRPMIVTAESVQSQYVEKYNLGISISNCQELDSKLSKWLNSYNHNEFCMRCERLLIEFLKDYNVFETQIINFLHCK